MGEDSLVGRANELRELRDHLARGARLVTLFGGPGFGKTRLARELLSSHEGPAHFCDASDCADLDALCAAVAGAIGALQPWVEADPSVHAIALALGAKEQSLLVLDGFEHCVAHASDSIVPWLASAPSLSIVVTSRMRLGLAGEVRIEVGPLSSASAGGASEAASLFLARAGGAHAAFRCPTDSVLPRIEELARHLDGNPLAIELAAARVGLVGLTELVERVAVAFDVLGETLGAAVRSSWELLSPETRVCLQACTQFRGGFDLPAVEALIGPRALHCLEELRDGSLLRSEVAPSGRARLRLYEAVRDFVARTSDENSELFARQCRYFLATSAEWAERASAGDAVSFARLLEDRSNVIAAFEWACERSDRDLAQAACAAVSYIGQATLPLARAASLLDRALFLGDGEHTAAAWLERATVRRHEGDLEGADRDLARAETFPQAVGDVMRGRLLTERAAVSAYRNDYARASTHAYEALAIARATGDRTHEGKLLNLLGGLAFYQARAADGVAYFVDASQLAKACGDLSRCARYLANNGLTHLELGAFDEAERFLDEAREMATQAGNPSYEALARGYLGVLARVRGDVAGSLDVVASTARELLARGMRREAAQLLSVEGESLRALGRFDEASIILGRAREVSGAVGDRVNVALQSAQLGALLAMRDRIEEAELEFALLENTPLPDAARIVLGVEHAHVTLARARRAAAAGDTEGAAAFVQRANEVLRSSGSTRNAMVPLELSLGTLEKALAQAATARAPMLRVSATHVRFGDVSLDCRRRPVARRILLALARYAISHPGQPLLPEKVIEEAWPGERMRPRSAKNRLHAAIAQLRRLGLRDALVTLDEGYLVDPAVRVTLDDG